MDDREELELFKRDIKLHQYAVSIGFLVDETSRRETILRRNCIGPGTGDKISVRMDIDGHYVYYSFRGDPGGTIVDFVMRYQRKSMGQARQALRIYLGSERSPALPVFEPLEPAPRGDRNAVASEYAAMKPLQWHDYLEQERKLPRAVLLSLRFKGRIRVDARANAIFPHYDDEGLCGFEKRNRQFKGFADLGEKGLWTSNLFPSDARLVIGESAIDCISHHVLFPDGLNRYASVAGGLNPSQPALIGKACESIREVICITHADKDGDRYADVIHEVCNRPFRIDRPEGVKDWNDVLKASDRHVLSFPAVLLRGVWVIDGPLKTMVLYFLLAVQGSCFTGSGYG